MNRTFFVFGGTPAADSRHLLCMVGYYDHDRHLVPQPVVVHDKEGVDDPHDNPSIQIDENGYVWVFISGRSGRRPGYIYRSNEPYSIDGFEQVMIGEFTYPQPMWIEGHGFVHLFTRYRQRQRELFFSTSDISGRTWSEPRLLASMGGHYQVTHARDGVVITAFNMHPDSVDRRTNLYFVMTRDRGESWSTVDGTPVELPLTDAAGLTLVRDYQREGRLVYVKDIQFDAAGAPAILYVTADSFEPGPHRRPRRWTIAHWRQNRWQYHEITTAYHNYDMGSLYIEGDRTWRVIIPSGVGPQEHGTGGEMAMWVSNNLGRTWSQVAQVTQNSEQNHGYARRPVNAHPDFYAFWADGNPDELSPSRLFFTDKAGENVWRLPYEMTQPYEAPVRLEPPEQ